MNPGGAIRWHASSAAAKRIDTATCLVDGSGEDFVVDASQGDGCSIAEGDDITKAAYIFRGQISGRKAVARKSEVVLGVKADDHFGPASMALDEGKNIIAGPGRDGRGAAAAQDGIGAAPEYCDHRTGIAKRIGGNRLGPRTAAFIDSRNAGWARYSQAVRTGNRHNADAGSTDECAVRA